MEWINIHTSILDSEPFADAEPIQRATWLSLLRYCCGQENNGVIRGCKGWADRKWQQLCGVTKEEAEQVCSLFRIEGEDLSIEFYPREKQAEIKAKRSAGKRGGKQRADNASSSASSTRADVLQAELGRSLKSASSTSQAELEKSFNGREGKGREWNRKEGNPRGVEEEAVKPVSESVSDETVIGFAAEWPGEMASGTPKMDPAWVVQWLARMNGRREWPGNWKRCLVAQWRADHRAFASGGSPVGGEKNAGGLSANVAAIERQKKLAALSEEEDALVYDVNALRQGNIEVPVEKTRRLAEVRGLMAEVRKEGE